MRSSDPPFLVAAAQVPPVFLDRKATVEKACAMIREAGEKGARLIVFPEAFVPGYPFWVWKLAAEQTKPLRALHAELLDQAITVPGEETDSLAAASAEAGVAVAIGVNELNAEGSGTTLYNSLVFISGGKVAAVHRKLIPTAGERLAYAQGDARGLGVVETAFGRLGGLICWENYMPLARFALYAAGVEIWVAPTWDRGEPWISPLRHVAKEGRVYVVGCGSALRWDDVPPRVRALLPPGEGWLNGGDSAIVDPDGKFVVEPVHERQEVVYGTVNPVHLRGPRWQLDVAGHYARPDLFTLTVDRNRRPHVREA